MSTKLRRIASRVAAVGTVLLLGAACASPAAIGPRCRPVASFAPWDATAITPERPNPVPAASLADALIAGYQRHMRIDHLPGQGCRLRPTCSTYGRQALARWHVLGFVLLVDRLFVRERAHMETYYVPACKVTPGDSRGLLDPVP